MSRTNPYTKTTWVDEETEVSADNLNNIEKGISDAFDDIIANEDALQNFKEGLMQEGETSSGILPDTVKKAVMDDEGNVITVHYATKAEDQAKLPLGDGNGTQTMNDRLEVPNDILTGVIESLSSKTSEAKTRIDTKTDEIILSIFISPNEYVKYSFKKTGEVYKQVSTADEVEEGETQTYTYVSKRLYIDLLDWLQNYVSESNNKIQISNSNLVDALINFTNPVARANWTSNDKEPATHGDVVNERTYMDGTFATKTQLDTLLEDGDNNTKKTDTSKKATADAEGNVITTTYATKAELTASDEANSDARQSILDNLDLKYNSTTGVTQLVHYTDKTNDLYTVLGTIDLPSEFILDTAAGKNYYDSVHKEIVLTLKDGTEIKIPAVNLVDVYNPQDTSTITITISTADSTTHERIISAAVKAGSITKTLLEQSILDDVNEAIDGEYGKSTGGTKANPVAGTRMAQENTRQSNEATRQSNETTRQSNEADRNTAEYGGLGYTTSIPKEGSRIYNENQRIANESARVSAENQRALDHTAWNTKVNETYLATIEGYWASLLELWNAKDSEIDSDLADYKLAKDNAIAEDLAAYKESTTSAVNDAVSAAIANYSSDMASWQTVVNSALGIGASPALDSTLDTLAEIIAYIKEAPNSEYASLIAHVEANTTAVETAQSDINTHKNNTNNPHNVTAAQVKAVSYEQQSLTTEQKVQARTNLGLGSAATKDAVTTITEGGTDVPTVGAIYSALLQKQNNLTIATAVTEGSTNPVTSGAVYTALEDKVDKVTGKQLSTYDFSLTYKNKLDATSETDTTSTANNGDVLLYNSNTHKMEKCPNGTYIIKNGKLSALVTDEISDTNQSNKFVNANEKAYVNEHTLKSSNLLNHNNKIETATITTNGVIATDTNNEFDLYIAPIQTGISYTANTGVVYAYYFSYPSIGSSAYGSTRYTNGFTNRTAPINGYVAIRVAKNTTNIMLNKGSEAQTYQPYNRNEHITNQDVENISKSLYHLGAFDSADGKTRQTGYDTGKKLVDYSITFENYIASGYQSNKFHITTPYSLDTNTTTIINNLGWDNMISTVTRSDVSIAVNDVNEITIRCPQTSVANFKAWLNQIDLFIQYKLASSYTDNIIENESILPLDSNMAQMIRQKVVDGLNLFPYSNEAITISNNIKTIGGTFNLKAGVYTISMPSGLNLDSWQYYINGTMSDNVYNNSTGVRKTITLSNDSTFKISLYKANNLTITPYIMLNEGSYPYPYSDFNQKEHITNDEATLLKNEEEKCRNLVNESALSKDKAIDGSSGGVISYSGYRASEYYIPITPNTYYSKTTNIQVYFYDSNYNYIANTYIAYNVITFLSPSSATYLRIECNSLSGQIMLNEGSEAKPYTKHYGEIVHTKDIEPVRLWKNPNSYSPYGVDDIDLSKGNFENYKFIVIAYRLGGPGNAVMYMKTSYKANESIDVMAVDGGGIICYRIFTFATPTKMNVGHGYSGGTENDNRCIPVAIYGTNVL